MDLRTRKREFIQEFLKIQSEEAVSRLENLLKKETRKLKNVDVEPMTMEEFNSRIDQSMEDSKNGRLISARELKTKIDKWD